MAHLKGLLVHVDPPGIAAVRRLDPQEDGEAVPGWRNHGIALRIPCVMAAEGVTHHGGEEGEEGRGESMGADCSSRNRQCSVRLSHLKPSGGRQEGRPRRQGEGAHVVGGESNSVAPVPARGVQEVGTLAAEAAEEAFRGWGRGVEHRNNL